MIELRIHVLLGLQAGSASARARLEFCSDSKMFEVAPAGDTACPQSGLRSQTGP